MYVLGAFPARFFIWHTPKAIALISARWLAFASEKPARHLLLCDFCYCVNALGLLYVWAWPRDAQVFQIFFLCANGPVAWSVLAFNQALVFHSWQHITSVFVHVSPMLLSYGLRWSEGAPAEGFVACEGGDFPRCAAAPAPGAMLWAALARFYAVWLVGYYFFIFLVLGRYVHERGFQTLFDRVSTQGPLAPLLRRLTRSGESELRLVKKAAYIAVHGALGTLTMALAAALFWRSQAAHFVFILAICTASAWNASSFYGIDVQLAVSPAPPPADSCASGASTPASPQMTPAAGAAGANSSAAAGASAKMGASAGAGASADAGAGAAAGGAGAGASAGASATSSSGASAAAAESAALPSADAEESASPRRRAAVAAAK
jgi:hypothetical protein